MGIVLTYVPFRVMYVVPKNKGGRAHDYQDKYG